MNAAFVRLRKVAVSNDLGLGLPHSSTDRITRPVAALETIEAVEAAIRAVNAGCRPSNTVRCMCEKAQVFRLETVSEASLQGLHVPWVYVGIPLSR
jgi:hypothetical protein